MSIQKAKQLKNKIEDLHNRANDIATMTELNKLSFQVDDIINAGKEIAQLESNISVMKELQNDCKDSETASKALQGKIKAAESKLAACKGSMKALEFIEGTVNAHEKVTVALEANKNKKNQKEVNPFKKETFNLTMQGRLLRDDKATAIRMAREANIDISRYL